MAEPDNILALLRGYRVLDLCDETGFVCGWSLAQLGADVIKVESPPGDTSRRLGPFYQDVPHPERSLYWFAYNSNKRSVTLNLETVDGRSLFRKLATTAHFVIESFVPGSLDSLQLGYEQLRELNRRLVLTSITPYGQTGPRAQYKASDLVSWATGGFLYLSGDIDRPPVRVSWPQAGMLAGAEAVAGTMIAHYHREATGCGQHVDVSIQQSFIRPMMTARITWDLNRVQIPRAGALRVRPVNKTTERVIWPCRDGYVSFVVMGGAMGDKTLRALSRWMAEEGKEDAFIRETKWREVNFDVLSQDVLDKAEKPIGEFFLTHTKQELYEQSAWRGIMLFPVADVADIRGDPHLQARGFWTKVAHPELGAELTYPGALARSAVESENAPLRAPLIGEHNSEIYERELGLSHHELVILKQAGVI